MKKVLAWAVVLALVLSSFTMAFAGQAKTSSEFKDASEIQYTEAVDVMVATGIINGFPDGTFGPQKTVTRGQMAKMIACIMNGGEDVGDQYKSACPFADSKDHWAAGYIAYCASEHIIDGRSADVFDPDADVTGTEVAKMALTSLGYDSKIQGYTGENWAAAVLKDAKKNKLFDGLDKSFVPGDPCPREAAAQILFNMLKAPMVEYATNTSVSVGDATVAVNSKASKVTPDKSGVKDDNKDGFTNLYEDVFGGDLSFAAKDADEFARPAHSWTYEKDDVGTYSDSADYEFTAEKAGLGDAIKAYDEDLFEDIKTYEPIVKVNGQDGNPGDVALGDKVELYVTEPVEAVEPEEEGEQGTPAKPGTVLAIVTQYQPYMITDVDTDVSDAQAKDGITAVLALDGKGSFNQADSDMAGYNESTYVKDTVIAIALGKEKGKDKVLDSYVLEEAANGEVSKVIGNPVTAFTVDGKKLEVTGNYYDFGKEVVAKEGNAYAFYDYNGYVIASVLNEEAAKEEFYGVIAKTGSGATDWDQDTASKKVQIFTTEGEFKPFAINKDCTGIPADTTVDNVTVDGLSTLVNKLVTYTVNEDGEIDSIVEAKGDFNAKLTPAKTMNGYDVSDEVAVFDIYELKDNQPVVKDSEDWAVLGIKDLEEADGDADGKIAVKASILDDTTYVAMQLVAPLTNTTTETVIGFISSVEEYKVDTDAYAGIVLWVDGKETEPYSTAKGVYTEAVARQVSAVKADQLVELTLDSDGNVTAIDDALTFEPVWTPLEKFNETYKGAIYDPSKADFAIYAPTTEDGYIYATGALQFGTTQVDKPNVSSATVYCLEKATDPGAKDTLSASNLKQIKPANNAVVKIYQVNADSAVWNIVVFYNSDTPMPTEPAAGGGN